MATINKIGVTDIAPGFTDKMMSKLLSYPPTKGSSMLTDKLNGNPIELGAKNSIIAKLDKQYKVATPINDLVVELLKFTNRESKIASPIHSK